MGRKGFKNFVKAGHAPGEAGDAAEEHEEQGAASTATASPAPSPAKQKAGTKLSGAAAAAAAPLVKPADATSGGGSDGEDDAEGGGDGPETRGQMLQRHKREMLAHKKALQRSGKKSKDDITRLTAGIEKRHAEELKQLDEGVGSHTDAAAGDGGKAASAAPSGQAVAAVGSAAEAGDPLSKYMKNLAVGDEGAGQARKPSKAQKRREKHAVRDAEREARIAAEKEALGTPERLAEEAALKEMLAPLGLGIKEIRADGHCMYRSIEDQLRQAAKGVDAAAAGGAGGAGDEGEEDEEGEGGEGEGDGVPSYQELRELAAEHIRTHREQYAPYLVPEVEGEDAAAFFDRHCDDIEMTAAWGGHVEINALAAALKRRITVYGVGMAPQALGEDHEGPALSLCFLRHALGLGDHYNSTRRLLFAPGACGGSDGDDGAPGA